MRLFLILILFSSYCFAEVPVTYMQDDTRHTVIGERYKSGYLFSAPNSKDTIHVVTEDWPPYIGNKLCNKGWVYQFAVSTFNSAGYNIYIEFVPWARAVRAVELGKADILLPEYFIEDTAPSDYVPNHTRRKLLGLSNSFSGGNIGFLKRKGEPDRFNGNLKSLKGSRIGVVRGYQNTPEFDAMMDNNEFIIIHAVDDLQLVKLLAAKRVDLIIGDPAVLLYSVKYASLAENEKRALLSAVEPESKVIQYNPLYFAISKKTPNWLTVLEDINTALYKFKNSGETQRIKQALLNECD
ncbi:substrate-binding periplasmic protein [Pseudoalteromonas agarivorans]|uniref:Amino acid ABC transporter substrate-binding protein n=1 Tax=Pseudoalteromonas agarivorans TaxID=176102 RepID=A0AAD0XEW1_9GAMM|nr:transporter substrate-binding domain-containing protein [Pseudoalteromonas agarivorans]AYM88750.1 amino acid ABC transporter substrate-binding protein [Pseudoalteromonas agarivorans]